jgi:hypothetical protein
LLTDILAALSPVVPEIESLKSRVGKLEGEMGISRTAIKELEDGKLPTNGLISITGTVDGVPAEILGGYVGTWIGPSAPETSDALV